MAVTPTYSWPLPDDTDLVRDGAEAMRDLGNAIDTTLSGFSTGPYAQLVTAVLSTGNFTTTSDSKTATGLKATITPTNASSTLMIQCVGEVLIRDNGPSTIFRYAQCDLRNNTTSTVVGTLNFVGRSLVAASTVDAASHGTFTFITFLSAGSTSAREYELRMNSASTDVFTQLYGGASAENSRASIVIWEILP